MSLACQVLFRSVSIHEVSISKFSTQFLFQYEVTWIWNPPSYRNNGQKSFSVVCELRFHYVGKILLGFVCRRYNCLPLLRVPLASEGGLAEIIFYIFFTRMFDFMEWLFHFEVFFARFGGVQTWFLSVLMFVVFFWFVLLSGAARVSASKCDWWAAYIIN